MMEQEQKMLGEPGIAYWRKQFYGNREAVTTAKA
jgi:hypothetical protein